MKKVIKSLVLAALLLILLPNIASATEAPIRIWMNGNYIQTDVEPFVENGRTLVPVRVISENLGYKVDWDNDTQTVSILSPATQVSKLLKLTIDNNIAHIVNPEFSDVPTQKTIDVAPKLVDARTFVPIRFIAEEFNVAVDWDAENSTVMIGDTTIYVPVSLLPPVVVEQINPLVGFTNSGSQEITGEVDPSVAAYIGNLNSFKFHRATCREVKKMNPDNKVGFNSRAALIDRGFVPCKICTP